MMKIDGQEYFETAKLGAMGLLMIPICLFVIVLALSVSPLFLIGLVVKKLEGK